MTTQPYAQSPSGTGAGRSEDPDAMRRDIDLTRAGVGPMERPFAWVPQEAAIVTGSIEENVALGAPGADPIEEEAARGAA